MMKLLSVCRSWKRFLVGSLLMVLLLSGCGQSPQQGQPGGAAPAVISLWHTLQGAEAAALDTQLQQLMLAHPDIIIKPKQVEEAKIVSLAYQAEAGGKGPDIYLAPQNVLLELYHQGSLAPVAVESNAFPAVAAQFRFGDKLYALPWLTDVPVLVYRKDLTVPPANLSEIFQKGGLVVPVFNTTMLGSWWSGQGGHVLNGAAPVLNATENLIFLQGMIAARDQKQLIVTAMATELFVNGQNPYLITWVGEVSRLNVSWGGIPLTDLQGGAGKTLVGTTLGIANAAIKTNVDLIEAIKSVEESLQAPEIELEMAKTIKHMPANVNAYPTTDQSDQKLLAAKALVNTWSITGGSREPELLQLLDKAWQNAWQGVASPLDALTDAQTEAQIQVQ